MEKTNIDQRYPEEIEAGREDAAYVDFLQVMSSTFDLPSFSSLIDVGCSNGNLIKLVKQVHQNIDVEGIEYFEYHKKYADLSVLDKIHFIDIRDPLPGNLQNKKFDIVICTEVGEHIDPGFCDSFLQNIKSLTGMYLIMTWSSHGGLNEPHFDPYHQHLNPLPLDSFLSLMSSKGFELNVQASNQLLESSMQFSNFFPWWRESLTVWTVK